MMRSLVVNALHYVRMEMLEGEDVNCAGSVYDGFGEPVPSSAVVDVAVVNPPPELELTGGDFL